MRRYISIPGLVMVLVAPASGAQATPPSSAPLTSLPVVVRDTANVPIADVLVQVLDFWGLLNEAQSLTSANGEMTLRLPQQRQRVTVSIHRQGFRSLWFDVNPDTVKGVLNVVLLREPARRWAGSICTADSRPGIRVRVTGAALNDTVTVRVVVRDGSYVDSSSANVRRMPRGIAVAYERAGTYAITVSAPGYRSWQRREVRVPGVDRFCGNRVGFPQLVEAELTVNP